MDRLPMLTKNVIAPEIHLKWWWNRNVSTMAKQGVRVWAICGTCNRDVELDLHTLAAKVPFSYSLINRRCHCRITPQCDGWNAFWHLAEFQRDGERYQVRMPLFDRTTLQGWLSKPETHA